MTEHVHDWRGGWVCGGADGCGAQHEASPWAFDGLEQASCNNVTAKINRLDARIAQLEDALASLRLTARVLLQNAVGCAANHYGMDYCLHYEPGWLRDCRASIEAAEAVLLQTTAAS